MARVGPIRVQVEGLPEVKAHIESLVVELNGLRELAARQRGRITELEAANKVLRERLSRIVDEAVGVTDGSHRWEPPMGATDE